MIRIGVTGTDTGVGKTLVTAALAAALTRRGFRVAAVKPIETGCEFDDPNRDGARLARAANETRGLAVVAPLTFQEPVAPMLAAELAARPIDLDALDRAVEKAAEDCDVLLLEGAGGLFVPITAAVSYAELFARWSLDVVIVAVNRLGAINHVRLTIAAARAAGLTVRAVVLNQIGGDGSDRSVGDNARLIALLEHVPIVQLPRAPTVDDLAVAANLVERSGLVDLIAAPAAVPPSV
ncbi:MAG: Dethiobiotin synthetase [Gemmatimonadetes bacterium]|nr:Dethiobiotin synthetase [Gemmatimonadota bacterium]